MPKQHIIVLSTGGTITSNTDSEQSSTYQSGGVDVADLIAVNAAVSVSCETLASVSSQDVDDHIWDVLLTRIREISMNNAADGIVVSHGTDTLEESAFLLELTLQPTCPIVLVGAMRTANTLGSDGERALANAIQVAAHPQSQGIIAISGDRILQGRTVYKSRTDGIDGFASYPVGELGRVTPQRVDYFTQVMPPVFTEQLTLPSAGHWPSVPIIYVSANMEKSTLLVLRDENIKGVVIAGVGHGNAPRWLMDELQALAAQGKSIVRSTRLNTGHVYRNLEVDDDGLNFIACRSLNPHKSRILLQLLLANDVESPQAQQQYFDHF